MSDREWTRQTLLETSGLYWRTCALHAAVKLDLFTRLGDGAATAPELAGKAGCSERGLTMLLNALTAMGLLAREGEAYRSTAAAIAYLSKGSDHYLGHIIQHHAHLMQSWAQLDEAVRTGKPVRSRASWADETVREAFLMGMYNVAMANAPQVAAQLDLSGCEALIDLGGGPGTYAIHFCLANPGLRATVYDLPTTRPFAEKTIARHDVGDRVQFEAGDFVEKPIDGLYDVAWLSQILHAEGSEECQRIVDKAASVLRPGGRLFVHEFLLDDTMDSPEHPALFSLNMLIGTAYGQSYSTGQIEAMLERAGLRDVRRLDFKGPNASGIVCGTK
jgi:precorrin-6B methylase 2